MLHLLDANVLITANNHYYPIDAVPEYWEWLKHVAENGAVKIPREIFEEIKEGGRDGEKDLLFAWVQQSDVKKALILDEEPDVTVVQKVVDDGYAKGLTDDQLEEMGRDPFLIAYCFVGKDRCVVTTEVSRPKRIKHNRKVPDVCVSLGLKWCDPFVMNRTLGFKTSWKKKG